MSLSNDDIRQLINILQRGLSNDNSEEETPKASKQTKPKAAPKKSKNKFDTMPEKGMHQEDIAIDKKLIRSPPTPRRDTFKPLKIACRVCGQTETIDPSIIESTDRYKCNKCSITPG